MGRALVFMLFFFYFLGFYFLGLGFGSDWEVEREIWGNGRTEGLGSHPSGISAGGRNQGMLGWKGAGMSFSEGGKKGFFPSTPHLGKSVVPQAAPPFSWIFPCLNPLAAPDQNLWKDPPLEAFSSSC